MCTTDRTSYTIGQGGQLKTMEASQKPLVSFNRSERFLPEEEEELVSSS
jgi:hypothetical protein